MRPRSARQLSKQLTDTNYREAYRQRSIKVGEGLTRLQIPAIDLDVNVVEGTTSAALRCGPVPGIT